MGTYEIVEATGYRSYFVHHYGDPSAALIKYPTQALSPLSPAILPCTPINTPDFRYLNHPHAPIPHPLRSPFNIQMYNNMWFSSSLLTDHPPMFKFTDVPDPDAPSSEPPFFPLSIASIPTDAALPAFTTDAPVVPVPPATAASLFAAIESSSDRLFYVSYQPANTLCPRWYLIQVDLPQSLRDPASCACSTDGHYYCHFLSKLPDDVSLPDPTSRWWLLWHRFSTSSDGIIEFGNSVLFNPTTTPDPASSYIAPGRTSSFRQMLLMTCWASLTASCVSRGILLPVLSSPPTIHSCWTRSSGHPSAQS